MAKLYKIRDKVTAQYWSGVLRCSTFNTVGRTWKSRQKAEQAVSYFLRYRSQWGITTNHSFPDSWEIVEIELVEKEVASSDMSEFIKYVSLRNEAEKICTSVTAFMDTMRGKKVIDDIEFIFKLKPAEGIRYVNFDRIKEARAHLRQLGVKTRTFRECNGMFGMMDRQQALRARLVLEVSDAVDLGGLRTKLGI